MRREHKCDLTYQLFALLGAGFQYTPYCLKSILPAFFSDFRILYKRSLGKLSKKVSLHPAGSLLTQRQIVMPSNLATSATAVGVKALVSARKLPTLLDRHPYYRSQLWWASLLFLFQYKKHTPFADPFSLFFHLLGFVSPAVFHI